MATICQDGHQIMVTGCNYRHIIKTNCPKLIFEGSWRICFPTSGFVGWICSYFLEGLRHFMFKLPNILLDDSVFMVSRHLDVL